MRLENFVVTLTTSAQALSSDPHPVYCRQILLQPGAANSNPSYHGGAGVTTTNGLRMEGQDSDGHPPAPFPLMFARDNPMDLRNVYVVGTAGETVRVEAVTV